MHSLPWVSCQLPTHFKHTFPLWLAAAAGLDFAGVHDSFWTHAGDVDRMSVILRDKFIELYSQVRADFEIVGG